MWSSEEARCSMRSKGSPDLASVVQDGRELQQQLVLREAEERRQRQDRLRRSLHMETRAKSRTKALVEDAIKSKLAPKLNQLAQRELSKLDHPKDRENQSKNVQNHSQVKSSSLDFLRTRAQVELRNRAELEGAKEGLIKPKIVVKRATLVRVMNRSPLKNAFQSQWEARHDVSNLDNYARREKQEHKHNNGKRIKVDEDDDGISISSSSDDSTSDSSDEEMDMFKIEKRASQRDDNSIFMIFSQRPFNRSRNGVRQSSKAIDIRF